jgi:hypothetical protein
MIPTHSKHLLFTFCKQYPTSMAINKIQSDNFSDLAKKIGDFFLLTLDSDKVLFNSIFDYANTSATHFKFTRMDGGTAEIFLHSHSRIICHSFLRQHALLPKMRPSLMDVKIISQKMENAVTLDYEAVKTAQDETLVSLWNSQSFSEVSVNALHLKYSRIFTRRDYLTYPPGHPL